MYDDSNLLSTLETPNANIPNDNIVSEGRYHNYTSNAIPWYVRLIWLGFWTLAIVYTIQYLFPALQAELMVK